MKIGYFVMPRTLLSILSTRPWICRARQSGEHRTIQMEKNCKKVDLNSSVTYRAISHIVNATVKYEPNKAI
jgi:hypothetical protein